MNSISLPNNIGNEAEKGRDSRNFSAFFDNRIKNYILEQELIPPGTHIICGVSGGADSTALLLALHDLGFSLEVLHVEHGIRGEESRADAAFTEELCRRLEIPCTIVSEDVPSFAAEKGLGIEEAARILRYSALKDRARKAGKDCRIALAHHMEDNAETLLFQMARGSGINGLCGIAPARREKDGIVYIRPLLCVQRRDIEAYLKARGQIWRTDSTNADDSYSRNRIRHRVLPELAALNSSAVLHMNRSAQQLCEVRDFLREQMTEVFPSVTDPVENGIAVSIPGLTSCHIALQKEILMEALERVCENRKDLSSLHIDQLLGLARGSSGHYIRLPYGVRAERSFDRLLICRDAGNSTEPVRTEETVKVQMRQFSFDGNIQKIPKNRYTKWFDYDKIKGGLSVRNRQSGDYLVIDKEGHRKKLKAYFIEQKIPEEKRDQVLLLAAESEILWVVGYRTGSGALVDENTREILEAVCVPEGSLYGF